MLIDYELIEWIQGIGIWKSIIGKSIYKEYEYNFSTRYLQPKSKNQWTNQFGEKLVRELLERKKNKVWIPKCINGKKLDLETPDILYEVKTRNYSTTGTIGEKIFGTAYKYCNVYKETGKKVIIVLVGYQEYEGRNKFGLCHPSKSQKQFLDFLYQSYKIKYIFCSQLL